MKKNNRIWNRKILIFSLLLIIIFSFTSCGNTEDKNRIKSAEERAAELQDDAKDAVNQGNEDVNQMNQSIDKIEE